MFRKFFSGRYGNDHLGIILLLISTFFGIVAFFAGGVYSMIFVLLQLIFIALWAMRAFSRNFYARSRENRAVLYLWRPFRNRYIELSKAFGRMKDRKHKYFKCPRCKSRLRVPRGRGEITVTCPRCRYRFDKKC